jgi:hypothetical protein
MLQRSNLEERETEVSDLSILEMSSAGLALWINDEVPYLSLFRRMFDADEQTMLLEDMSLATFARHLTEQMKILEHKMTVMTSRMSTVDEFQKFQEKYREDYSQMQTQIRELFAKQSNIADVEVELGRQGQQIFLIQDHISDIEKIIDYMDDVAESKHHQILKQLNEIRDELSLQETSLEAQEQSISALLPLLDQVNTLVTLGLERNKACSDNEELRLLRQDPFKRAMYDCITATLSSLYLAASVIQTNKVALSQGNSFVGCVGTVLSVAGSHVPLVGLAVTALGQTLVGIDASLQAQAMSKIFALVGSIGQMEELAHKISYGLITEPRYSMLNRSKLHRGSVFGAICNMFSVAMSSVLNQTVIQDVAKNATDLISKAYESDTTRAIYFQQEADAGTEAATLISSSIIEYIVADRIEGLFDEISLSDRAQLLLREIMSMFEEKAINGELQQSDAKDLLESRNIVIEAHLSIKNNIPSKHPERESRFIEELAQLLLLHNADIVRKSALSAIQRSDVVIALAKYLKMNSVYKTSPMSRQSKLLSAFVRSNKKRGIRTTEVAWKENYMFGVSRDFIDNHDSFMKTLETGIKACFSDLYL